MTHTPDLTIAPGIIWWLKPFWDRGPLLIISKFIFAEKMSCKEFLSAYPSLLSKNFLPWLTYRRITVARSFIQPVTILEGLSSSNYRKRVGNLNQNAGSAPRWLTLCCAHFELFLVLGIYSFIIILIPNEVDIDYWEMIEQQSATSLYLSNTLTYLCMVLIAPFYICAGFMLYINRRILLEGWDIEIQFRLLASRCKPSTSLSTTTSSTSIGTVALIILLSLCPMSIFSNKAVADDALSSKLIATKTLISPTIPSAVKVHHITKAEDAKDLITEIKSNEDFGRKKHILLHRFINSGDSDNNLDDSWLTKQMKIFAEWLRANIDSSPDNSASGITFSQIVEVLLWLTASMIIIYVVLLCLHWLKLNPDKFQYQRQLKTNTKPEVLFGLVIDNQQNTKNVSQHTLALWQDKKYRAALALMYGVLLSKLIHRYNFDFSEGFTEQECAQLVDSSEQMPSLIAFVKDITQCWLLVAYAHRTPSPLAGERLCKKWSELFDAK